MRVSVMGMVKASMDSSSWQPCSSTVCMALLTDTLSCLSFLVSIKILMYVKRMMTATDAKKKMLLAAPNRIWTWDELSSIGKHATGVVRGDARAGWGSPIE